MPVSDYHCEFAMIDCEKPELTIVAPEKLPYEEPRVLDLDVSATASVFAAGLAETGIYANS
jgi:hypothetical protein